MAGTANGEQPRVYAVRLSEDAGDEIEEEQARLEDVSGPDVADDWQQGLSDAIRSLATYPERCVVAPENVRFAGTVVRQLLYRRKRGPIWRILFTVHEADANDPPTVRVHHVRHGARPPMTQMDWPPDRD